MRPSATAYAERLFDYPELGPLSGEDATDALQEPVQKEGVEFTKAAINEIVRVTKGYAYFLQEWGYQAWNITKNSPIDIGVVHEATKQSIARLDASFFRVRLDRTTPREKTYMQHAGRAGARKAAIGGYR